MDASIGLAFAKVLQLPNEAKQMLNFLSKEQRNLEDERHTVQQNRLRVDQEVDELLQNLYELQHEPQSLQVDHEIDDLLQKLRELQLEDNELLKLETNLAKALRTMAGNIKRVIRGSEIK